MISPHDELIDTTIGRDGLTRVTQQLERKGAHNGTSNVETLRPAAGSSSREPDDSDRQADDNYAELGFALERIGRLTRLLMETMSDELARGPLSALSTIQGEIEVADVHFLRLARPVYRTRRGPSCSAS